MASARKPRETRKTPRKPRKTRKTPRKTGKTPRREPTRLLPIMRPSFNLREVIKELSLLEDHLINSAKRCHDCINKHFLKTEGLLEECKSLCAADNPDAQRESAEGARTVRVLHHAWAARPFDPAVAETVAASLRQLRKRLMAAGHAALPVGTLPDEERRGVAAVLLAARKRQRK